MINKFFSSNSVYNNDGSTNLRPLTGCKGVFSIVDKESGKVLFLGVSNDMYKSVLKRIKSYVSERVTVNAISVQRNPTPLYWAAKKKTNPLNCSTRGAAPSMGMKALSIGELNVNQCILSKLNKS